MTNPTLPLREKIGYLIYQFDATTDGDRNRVQYLELADQIIEVSQQGAPASPE